MNLPLARLSIAERIRLLDVIILCVLICKSSANVPKFQHAIDELEIIPEHGLPAKQFNGQTEHKVASVNRHVLLQIHASVTQDSDDCNTYNPSWILTIDEVDIGGIEAGSNPGKMVIPSQTSSTMPLDRELRVTWNSLDSELIQGQASTALTFPLQEQENKTPLPPRTLILALWHETSEERILLARQVTLVPRSEGSGLPLRTQVPLQGHLKATCSTASRIFMIRAAGICVIVAITSTLVILFVAGLYGSFSYAMQQRKRRHLHQAQSHREDRENVQTENLVPQEQESQADSLTENGWPAGNSSEEESSSFEEEELAQGEKEQDEDENESEGENDHDRDFSEAEDNFQQATNHTGFSFHSCAAEVLIRNQTQAQEHPARGLRPLFDDNASTASSQASSGPALPPSVERHVVRPLPVSGITFESEMERFNLLQLGSPQGSRTGQEVVVRHSSAITNMLSQPTFASGSDSRLPFLSPSHRSFGSPYASQATFRSPLSWQPSVLTSNGKSSEDSARVSTGTGIEFMCVKPAGNSSLTSKTGSQPEASNQQGAAQLPNLSFLPAIKKGSNVQNDAVVLPSPRKIARSSHQSKPECGESETEDSKLTTLTNFQIIDQTQQRSNPGTEEVSTDKDNRVNDSEETQRTSVRIELDGSIDPASRNEIDRKSVNSTEESSDVKSNGNIQHYTGEIALRNGGGDDGGTSPLLAHPTVKLIEVDHGLNIPGSAPKEYAVEKDKASLSIQSTTSGENASHPLPISEPRELRAFGNASKSHSHRHEVDSESSQIPISQRILPSKVAAQASQPAKVFLVSGVEQSLRRSEPPLRNYILTSDLKTGSSKMSASEAFRATTEEALAEANEAPKDDVLQKEISSTDINMQTIISDDPEAHAMQQRPDYLNQVLQPPPINEDECEYSKIAESNPRPKYGDDRDKSEIVEADARSAGPVEETERDGVTRIPKDSKKRLHCEIENSEYRKRHGQTPATNFRSASSLEDSEEIDVSIPRVTPPYEKPLAEATRTWDDVISEEQSANSLLVGDKPRLDDFSSAAKEQICSNSGNSPGKLRAHTSTESRSGFSAKAESAKLQKMRERVSRGKQTTAHHGDLVSSMLATSKTKYLETDIREAELERSPSFTYVSTLSPDSRTSSNSNWSSSGMGKGAENRSRSLVTNDRKPSSKPEHDHSSKQNEPALEWASASQEYSRKSEGDDDRDEVQVVGVRPAPEGIAPDVVFSESLRNAMEDLGAPTWKFNSEEALKPVERKRRRARRNSTRPKAPFMSPGSVSGSRSGTKRKFVDLTEFKTPPLTDPGQQAKRRLAAPLKAALKQAPQIDNKNSTEPVDQPPLPDTAASKSSSKTEASRGKTFARRGRQAD